MITGLLGVPSLGDLASLWVDPNTPVTSAMDLGGEQRDLATINNFYGSVGIAPQGKRPVDLFAVNSLELPPFAGCGAVRKGDDSAAYGCGRMLIDGQHVGVDATQWSAYEAGRRATLGSGVVVQSATRMAFEQNAVLWTINLTNPVGNPAAVQLDLAFELGAPVAQFASVGQWVYSTPSLGSSSFDFSDVSTNASATAGQPARAAVLTVGTAAASSASRPAAARFAFVGEVQPSSLALPQPPAPVTSCDISGEWRQNAAQEIFTIATVGAGLGPLPNGSIAFNLTHSAADAQHDGWSYAHGLLDSGGGFRFWYFRPSTSPGSHGWVPETGRFIGDCNHTTTSDGGWARQGAPPPAPAVVATQPEARFSALSLPAGGSAVVRLVLSVGSDPAAAAAVERGLAADVGAFDAAWSAAASLWEERWSDAFTPSNGFWSGHLPTLELDTAAAAGTAAAGVARVFYMSILTVVSMARTNLPLVFDRVFVNGQGNGCFGGGCSGIGGSRSWWWDEGLAAMMVSLLEPAGRPNTLHAWLAHDAPPAVYGHGIGNGYAMDCEPVGSTQCTYAGGDGETTTAIATATTTAAAPPRRPAAPGRSGGPKGRNGNAGPEYGFYCYNPSAYFSALGAHLRINNDSAFLASAAHAASSPVYSVDDALHGIATDWTEYLVKGTMLVDYGPSMDGFSPTYKHVMPGCSQGNNIWMLREMARLRTAQGNASAAAELRAQAAEMAAQTIAASYTSQGGHGWFNVLADEGPANGTGPLTAYEMRHVVDFFSVTIGMCSGPDAECDLTPRMRAELGAWFHHESRTKTWIRATSPRTNCSRTWAVPRPGNAAAAAVAAAAARGEPAAAGGEAAGGRRDLAPGEGDEEFPAYSTCRAGRPDHGSNGAYPSWPAFALEALCYLDGNCSAAFDIMGTFADNTLEGPFGQAHEVPQLSVPPYTPFDGERAFKPVAGATRYIAIEGGSFFDAILRGFFGYNPAMAWGAVEGSTDAAVLLRAALREPEAPRGFSGRLLHLRTPVGLATISSGPTGLSIATETPYKPRTRL